MSDPFQISSIEIRHPVEGSVDDLADDWRERRNKDSYAFDSLFPADPPAKPN